MSSAPLVAVAHGSRDPRSAESVRALSAAVADRAPGIEVHTAFLDLTAPTLGEVLERLHARGHSEAVVVPLLLGSAFHARVDLPQLVAQATSRLPLLRVSVADVLGPDPALESAAADRLAQAGADPAETELGIALTGVGSAHPPANQAVARVAERWNASTGGAAVTHAFATASPDVRATLARLRARGARRFALAPWFLAPGLLLDRIAEHATQAAPGTVIAGPLGSHPRVADLVLTRYEQAELGVRHAA